jgi:hypothetical protein
MSSSSAALFALSETALPLSKLVENMVTLFSTRIDHRKYTASSNFAHDIIELSRQAGELDDNL